MRARSRTRLLGAAAVRLLLMAVLLCAWMPPTAAQIKSPALPERPTLKVPAIKPPAERASVIVVPRENCGTVHTGWVNDPEADVNPCPKACERGERLWVSDWKSGAKTLYDGVYRCYLPELVVAQPPGALSEPGAVSRTNCGTHWTPTQNEPNTDVNPCPANCERGELLDVRRSRSDDKAYYQMNYRCYVAEAGVKAATPSAARTGTDQTASSRQATERTGQSISLTTPPMRMTGRWPLQPAANVTLTAGAIQMTGRWLASLANTVIASDAIRMRGRWPLQPAASVTLTAAAIQMTGRWPASLASTVIASNAIRMTGRWPAVFTPLTITTGAIRMTGQQP